MGAHKGAARVGACLVPLENNLYLWDLFLPLVGRGEAFFGCHFLYARGGGAFSHYLQNCFGAHTLVARVIANMLLL